MEYTYFDYQKVLSILKQLEIEEDTRLRQYGINLTMDLRLFDT
jgi:hypothetical protein